MQTLGDLPLIVLSRGLGHSAADQVWQTQQSGLLHMSTRSGQLIAETSGHNIESDQPQAAVRAIVKMVEQVRSAKRK